MGLGRAQVWGVSRAACGFSGRGGTQVTPGVGLLMVWLHCPCPLTNYSVRREAEHAGGDSSGNTRSAGGNLRTLGNSMLPFNTLIEGPRACLKPTLARQSVLILQGPPVRGV